MAPLLWQATSHFLATPAAFAADPPLPNGQGPLTNNPITTKITLFDPLRDKTLSGLLNTILQDLTLLAIPVVAIMVMIGAYYIITSGGEPAKRNKGKDYIIWSAIGFALLLLATSISTILQNWLAPAA